MPFPRYLPDSVLVDGAPDRNEEPEGVIVVSRTPSNYLLMCLALCICLSAERRKAA
jgi:hypothetical protein